MLDPKDYTPARPPFPPFPKKFTGRVIRVVTVPGGSNWKCSFCGTPLLGGVQAGKLGKIVLCTECVKRGKH